MYYIYKIENLKNHKVYIGLTNNLIRRKNRHFSDLRRNCHDNSFLQKEYNIYGEGNFSFEKIYEGDITEEEIGEKEKYYIKLYDSYREGYNQNEGGNFGASNGGTQLTRTDILTILSVLDNMSRPGQVLADIFGISRTTISRIKKGINHCQYKEEYDKMPSEEKKIIYETFCEAMNLEEKKHNSSKIQSKRKLTEDQVLLILANFEYKILPWSLLMQEFKIKSSNTFDCIKRKQTYQDINLIYESLSQSKKQELASQLRNRLMKTP